ncbi:MAG: hypothetical protein B6I24_08350 [Bacteroidetes bacterium 4572_128]|nr:MAG: hypothetical protein B6I24_08350 [Bacteroidetes bacterium 4572_128]
MKRIKNSLLAFLLIFAFIAVNLTFTSCEKDEEETPPVSTVKHDRLNKDEVTWKVVIEEMKKVGEDRSKSVKNIDEQF